MSDPIEAIEVLLSAASESASPDVRICYLARARTLISAIRERLRVAELGLDAQEREMARSAAP